MPPKRIKKREKGAPPVVALRRYDELLELQKKKRASPVISLADAIADSERSVTSALEDAGILEHRAIVTGKVEDADAYSESLVRLDAAYAELWAREALGHRLRIDEVNEERDRVVEEGKTEELRIPRQQPRPLESRMEFRRTLLALSPPPEDSVQISGIRDSGAGAKEMGSDAAASLRSRLSQVAKVSEGPTTVKVLRNFPRRPAVSA